MSSTEKNDLVCKLTIAETQLESVRSGVEALTERVEKMVNVNVKPQTDGKFFSFLLLNYNLQN